MQGANPIPDTSDVEGILPMCKEIGRADERLFLCASEIKTGASFADDRLHRYIYIDILC